MHHALNAFSFSTAKRTPATNCLLVSKHDFIPPDEEIYVLEYETDNDEINGIESHEESNEETDNIETDSDE